MTVEHWNAVEAARVAFEARWQPSSVAVVDSELFDRFKEQLDLWNEAYATGSVEDIEIQAGGMIRAYEAATKLLEGHRMTAFLLAHDHEAGVSVCISSHSESVEHAKKSTDYPVEWVTPEAVVRLVAQAKAMETTIADKEDRLS